MDIDDGFWKSHGGRVLKEKSKDNLYEVKGLREDTDYVFKFRQISDVGFGLVRNFFAFSIANFRFR